MAVRILQGNLQRSRLAQDLLDQFSRDHTADLLILSEQHRGEEHGSWYGDLTGTAAIKILSRAKFPVTDSGAENGFVWIKTGNRVWVSCYLSPNVSMDVFRARLASLEDAITGLGGELVVAGDFNSKAVDWGSDETDSRGRAMLEMAARLDLIVLNTGGSTTFRRSGTRGSIVDVTLATPSVAGRINNWRVLEEYTASDHQFVSFTVAEGRDVRATANEGAVRGWNAARLDRDKLREVLGSAPLSADLSLINSREAIEVLVARNTRHIASWCDASMPRRVTRPFRRPAYWWTPEIGELRGECHRLRRRVTRTRHREPEAEALYKSARKKLVGAIRASKHRCMTELREEINRDPWGLGYQIATKRFGKTAPVAPMEPYLMKSIVDSLFPDHPEREHRGLVVDESVPLFTKEELLLATADLPARKAPGPDGIPNEVLKVVALEKPSVLLDMYNACLRVGVVSGRWKIQRLVLLDKGKGYPVTPSSFRPLCMLDGVGKIFERLNRRRLRHAVEIGMGLADNQYGFREGRSTVMAAEEVLLQVHEAWSGSHKSRDVCALVTLDVKNAFNSARWRDILEALHHFRVPEYLYRVLEDYLRDRVLRYMTTEGQREKRVTSGVAQGSSIGPDLWNLLYDGLLRLEMPMGARLIGFADDVALLVRARTEEALRLRIGWSVRRIARWLSDHGLDLAAAKTEMVVLTRRRNFDKNFQVSICGAVITCSPYARYLGIWFDPWLSFNEHLRRVQAKASKLLAGLARMMPNIAGPREDKRRLLVGVANSILLYGAEVWAEALELKGNRQRLTSVQRIGALRVAMAYRTVSAAAVMVIAGVIPIVWLAKEKRARYLDRRGGVRDIDRREETVRGWQDEWDRGDKGRWTHRLIPQIRPWLERTHGQLSFYLTQFLSGHGAFAEYLHRMGKKASPGCQYCPDVVDSAEHTIFVCGRWAAQRTELEAVLGEPITPENLISTMLQSRGQWVAVDSFARDVLKAKRLEQEE